MYNEPESSTMLLGQTKSNQTNIVYLRWLISDLMFKGLGIKYSKKPHWITFIYIYWKYFELKLPFLLKSLKIKCLFVYLFQFKFLKDSLERLLHG